MRNNEITLMFPRVGSGGLSAMGILTIQTSNGESEAMSALCAAVSEWVKTTEAGLRLWAATSQDLNIGDLAEADAFRDSSLQKALSARGMSVVRCHIGNAESFIPFDRVLANPSVVEKQFTVTITSETWDEDSTEAGETDAKEVLVDGEVVSNDDLRIYAQKFSTAVPTDGAGTAISLRSVYPAEDRGHFERGEDTYYHLHVTEVNGLPPTAEDRVLVHLLAGAKPAADCLLPTDIQRLVSQCERRRLPDGFLHEPLMEAAWQHATSINHDGAARQLEFLAALPPNIKEIQPGDRIEVVVDKAVQGLARDACQKSLAEQLLLLANMTSANHATQVVLNYEAPSPRIESQRG